MAIETINRLIAGVAGVGVILVWVFIFALCYFSVSKRPRLTAGIASVSADVGIVLLILSAVAYMIFNTP